MSDSFQRVEHRSWGSRLRGSIGGVVVGLALVVGGVVLLFWNEGRSVLRYKTLKEGASTVLAVASDRVEGENEGRLIHVSGTADADGVVEDSRFGVEAAALKLIRSVEMYQWVERTESEERNKLGGGTERVTTYRYEQEWSARAVGSSSFEEPEGHRNPPFPIHSEDWVAEEIELGAFELGATFVGQINRETAVEVDSSIAGRASSVLGRKVVVASGRLYAGDSPGSPELGDLRIRYSMVEPAAVSVVGAQRGRVIEGYEAETGGRIALLKYGQVAATEMFEAAQGANRVFTWVVRLGGFLLLFIAFGLILRPARVLADVLPIAGRVVGAGLGFVSFFLAFLVGLVVIAVGWFFYRPLLSLVLLALALGCVILLVRRGKKAKVELPPLPVPDQS